MTIAGRPWSSTSREAASPTIPAGQAESATTVTQASRCSAARRRAPRTTSFVSRWRSVFFSSSRSARVRASSGSSVSRSRSASSASAIRPAAFQPRTEPEANVRSADASDLEAGAIDERLHAGERRGIERAQARRDDRAVRALERDDVGHGGE